MGTPVVRIRAWFPPSALPCWRHHYYKTRTLEANTHRSIVISILNPKFYSTRRRKRYFY